MGYLQELIKDYRKRKRQQKIQPPQTEIETLIENEKMKNRIEFIKQWEYDNFLYGRGNEIE